MALDFLAEGARLQSQDSELRVLQKIAYLLGAGIGGGGLGGPILAAGENHIGELGGRTYTATDTFTRPADTTAYTAGDAVSATTSNTGTTVLRSVPVARTTGGTGYITKIRLWLNKASITARFRIHFYNVNAPPTAVVGDNSPNTVMFANASSRKGYLDMPAMTSGQTGSDASWTQNISDRLPFTCVNGDQNLYYRLETLDAWTPDSGQSFFLAVTTEQN